MGEEKGWLCESPPSYSPAANNPAERVFGILSNAQSIVITKLPLNELENLNKAYLKSFVQSRMSQFTKETMLRIHSCNRDWIGQRVKRSVKVWEGEDLFREGAKKGFYKGTVSMEDKTYFE